MTSQFPSKYPRTTTAFGFCIVKPSTSDQVWLWLPDLIPSGLDIGL